MNNTGTTGITLEQWESLKTAFKSSFYGAKVTANRITLDREFIAKFDRKTGIMEYDYFSAEKIFSRLPN